MNKQEHIEKMAQLYAEQILANSLEIAKAMANSAVIQASGISKSADELGQVMVIEATKKAAKEVSK